MSEVSPVSTQWVLVSTILVFVMQVGFCCLESGFARAKNSINVAMKNLVDFLLAGLLFWTAGYALMFGASAGGWVGTTGWLFSNVDDVWHASFFLFQLMFCGTTATIVSGAVAERMKFSSYIITTAICSLLVYPLFGHWAWGGANEREPSGWLAQLGFIDFAGSTVVHSVGGWVALAALLVIGPRLGAFSRSRRGFAGSNLPLATIGALLLWFGWFGFNGGSALAFDGSVPRILINTVLGGCAGGLATLALSYLRRQRQEAGALINGTLAGLVAITANCHIVSPSAAVAIGAIGGLVAVLGVFLLQRLRIDDAVGAVPVHLFAGIWGTIAVALFGNVTAFPNAHGRLEQLAVQATGISACAALAFPVSLVLLLLVSRVHRLRVSRQEEVTGLSMVIHGASSPLQTLIQDMERHRRLGRTDGQVRVELGSDVEPVAIQYNRVARSLAAETQKLERAIAELTEARDAADRANQAKTAFLANMSHELRTPLNAVIGFSEMITSEIYGPLGDAKYAEMATDIHNSGRHLLSLVNDILDHSKIEAGMMDTRDEDIDLPDMLAAVARLIGARADAAGLGVDIKPSEGLPHLVADERSIRQILLNLLSNAIKFSQPGGRIALDAALMQGRIVVSVTVSGIGMEEADIVRAMEPFVQLDNPLSKRYAGTGLGLALVKSLARLHGAELKVTSKPGKGTRIEIVFPQERTGAMGAKASGKHGTTAAA